MHGNWNWCNFLFLPSVAVVIMRRSQARLLVAVTMLNQGVSVEIKDYLLESI